MMEPSSAAIAGRARTEPATTQAVVSSVAAHLLVLAAIALFPSRPSEPPVRQVMTINLTGAAGERTGGMTQIGGAQAAPVSPKPPAPTPERPRPAARPRAVVPAPKPAARSTTPTPAPPARTPPTVQEPATGNTPVVTGARGQGFGLSSAGGSGAGRRVELDVSNFCCPEYLERMMLAIQRGWDRNQGVAGAAVITFTIHRDGAVDPPSVRKPSGFFALDNAALRAVVRADRLPPLPAQFPNATLTVHVTFEYQQ